MPREANAELENLREPAVVQHREPAGIDAVRDRRGPEGRTRRADPAHPPAGLAGPFRRRAHRPRVSRSPARARARAPTPRERGRPAHRRRGRRGVSVPRREDGARPASTHGARAATAGDEGLPTAALSSRCETPHQPPRRARPARRHPRRRRGRSGPDRGAGHGPWPAPARRGGDLRAARARPWRHQPISAWASRPSSLSGTRIAAQWAWSSRPARGVPLLIELPKW